MILFWSFFDLATIITALIATRILEQFVAQVFAIFLLRNLQPQRPRPWKMWFYPLPCFIALAGWLFVYRGTGRIFVVIGIATLLAGALVFLIWSRRRGDWPFTQGEPRP
jgi:hypothetical protein